MDEHIGLIIEIAIGIIMLGLGWYIRTVDKRLTKMEDGHNEQEEKIKKVQLNYLGRFDEVKDLVNSQFGELKVLVANIQGAVDKQAAICAMIQDAKKKDN